MLWYFNNREERVLVTGAGNRIERQLRASG